MSYVLDSCLLLAFLRKEKNWKEVKEYLEQAKQGKIKIFISWMNLSEVYYKVYRKLGQSKANKTLAIIKSLPLEIILPKEETFIKAGKIKGQNPIAFVDCFTAALAEEKKAKIITGDPEFEQLENNFEIIWMRL